MWTAGCLSIVLETQRPDWVVAVNAKFVDLLPDDVDDLGLGTRQTQHALEVDSILQPNVEEHRMGLVGRGHEELHLLLPSSLLAFDKGANVFPKLIELFPAGVEADFEDKLDPGSRCAAKIADVFLH